MKKSFFIIFPAILILFLAIGLRFFHLGSVPIELNRDEASLGYTAYSILKTGHDEHGATWPLSIQSFGDWKLPGYIYTLIPFIGVFGLENWVVKLPSALAGIGIVILAGANTWVLTNSWLDLKRRYLLTLLVSLMIAISPWNIHMSHMAYEANLAMFFFMLAFFFFQIGLKKIDSKKDGETSWRKEDNFTDPRSLRNSSLPGAIFLISSVFFFGLTLFTYHSFQIFTPLIALGLLFIYKDHALSILKDNKKTFFSSLALAGIFSFTLIFTTFNANKTKLSGLFIFDPSSYDVVTQINRGYFENRNSILAKLHTNDISMIANQVQRNLSDIFSAKFLFFEGGTHGSHDIPGTGKMYPIAFIFLLLAGAKFFQDFKDKKLKDWQKIIILWLSVSVIAPAITFEAAHTIRFSPALFALEFLSAYGLLLILENLWGSKLGKFILFIITTILAYSLLNFLLTYFIVAPKRDTKNQNWQMKRIVSLTNERGNKYDKIVMPGASWSPYIYFLYYNKYDPNLLQKDLEFYPTDHEGFKHVKRLGNIYFEAPDWDVRESANENVLYVIKTKEIPGDKLQSSKYNIEYSLTNPYAKYEWILLGHE